MAPILKLTGAQATLYAKLCEHYIGAAEDECNDTPSEIPLFSWLSPQQRLTLVKDLMIGVLCENEPLPPDTIQHNATHFALIQTLFYILAGEDDMQWEIAGVGRDLLNHDYESDRKRFYTPEEQKVRAYQRDLIEHQAEKNKNKMKRKGVGKFSVEEEPENPVPTIEDYNRLWKNYGKLFEGGPVSIEERKSIRPLSDNELHAFRWRRLCDAAFQEDNHPLFPLSAVNFDWRCNNLNKWYTAIEMLLELRLVSYGSTKERALIFGEINEYAYADRAKLPRIREVEKHVELLRKVYESKWDPKKLSIDQRCIYAVCSNVEYAGYGHMEWVSEFITTCHNRGIDFTSGGNYQARLDIFREMKDKYDEGLAFKFSCFGEVDAKSELLRWEPQLYKPPGKFEGIHCHGPGKYYGCYETKNLQKCSRCKVVMYCSVAW